MRTLIRVRKQKRKGTYSGVALLGLAGLAGEDNEFGLVGLQPLNVQGLALLAQVPPPVIDHDTNTTSLLPTNASFLQFSESKSTSLLEFSVIADCLGTDGGSEQGERANTEGGSLDLAGLSPTDFGAWLIEPGADPALPVFSEMVCVEN